MATTSHIEGLYIAKDVVNGFRYLGARVLFNIHIHYLAEAVDEINMDIEGRSNVASLVTGIDKDKRSYKVYFAPLGISYAKDIAEKYGVTFEVIKENIEKQNSELLSTYRSGSFLVNISIDTSLPKLSRTFHPQNNTKITLLILVDLY